MNLKQEITLPEMLYSAEITPEDLAKSNASIAEIYKYKNSLNEPKIKYHLEVVLRVASDGFCNLCHELKVDPLGFD